MPNSKEKTIQYDDEPNPRGVIKHVVILAEVNGYNTPFYVRGVYTTKYRAQKAADLFYRYLPEYKSEWENINKRIRLNKSLPYHELHMIKCELDLTYLKQVNTMKEALKHAEQPPIIHEGDPEISTIDDGGVEGSITEGS